MKQNLPEKGDPAFRVRLVANNTEALMNIMLPDSSQVALSPHSSISYKEPFQDGKRSIELKGEAYFEVVKNARMPFVVASYPLSTTVLGTVFSVKSFEKDRQIKVSLFKGVVAVGNADSSRPAVRAPFYLSPGDVLTYDKQNGQVRFISAKSTQPSSNDSEKGGNTSLPDNTMADNNWYMFNNQPLTGVLDQLSLLYNQKISYSAEDLSGLSFIGRIDKTDTLETILQLIGRLNNLQVVKEPNGFLMKKPGN
ncbi:FecR family protein [Niabella hibiscisoli]|uniref:FecR family protein n=1 Tax=Niabella hibiscisoli TaxID=1825928 RepID=UPI001F0E23AF|nr:FecR domain-containing protein [Niabella hibiscisoli]MCH5715597.1 FecR domain-containing protein [Niabella hibiscisoli]